MYNISTEELNLLAQRGRRKVHKNMRVESAYGCMTFSISKNVYNNKTSKTSWISTHGYQAIKSNMCLRYKLISHDPDNTIHALRNVPGQVKRIREDVNKETIYHEYGNSYNSLKRNMITILRDPKGRLISAFLDSFHHEGMTAADFQNLSLQLRKIDDNKKLEYEDRVLRKLQYIVTLPDFYGCQVKMLNGVPCTSKLLVSNGFNQTALDFAIQRLKQYMFVGIFERYADTINMLHFYAGVSTKPHPVELIKFRTTNSNISSYIKERLEFNDPYDNKLYEVALNIFNQKYEIYKKSNV